MQKQTWRLRIPITKKAALWHVASRSLNTKISSPSSRFLDECRLRANANRHGVIINRVEKPDRDRTEAGVQPKQEFQIFLQKYPQSPLVPQVQQQLRNVQEILADGDFRIAQFYYTKFLPRGGGASTRRRRRYPLYSKADKTSGRSPVFTIAAKKLNSPDFFIAASSASIRFHLSRQTRKHGSPSSVFRFRKPIQMQSRA